MGTAAEIGLRVGQRGVAVDGFLHVGDLRHTGLRLNPGEGGALPNIMVSVFTAESVTAERTSGTVIAERTLFTTNQQRFQNGSADRAPGSRIDLHPSFSGLIGGPEDTTARTLQEMGVEIWLATEPNKPPRVQIVTPWDESNRPPSQSPHHELLTLPMPATT